MKLNLPKLTRECTAKSEKYLVIFRYEEKKIPPPFMEHGDGVVKLCLVNF